eukprot:TRINITY_DN14064_c0_g1_i1.p2 TRINITY_DN14064_c0_g1~~TRINITY_DN14064_c0_g1_i1.p2  ORF type:complete len:289 (+),score=78.85 TRINITY_DN14064_c0_g1_i1:109-975(+)
MERFACPGCGQVAQGVPGTTVACPKCQQACVVPGKPGALVQPGVVMTHHGAVSGAFGGSTDPFGGRDSLLINQEIEIAEICGCEMTNKYRVGDVGSDDYIRPGTDTMFVHEESDCCERICCQVNRELTLFLRYGRLAPPAQARQMPLVLQMHKPFHLQFCCCCRPSFDVADGVGQPVGRIEDPFVCCTIDQKWYRHGEELPAYTTGPVACCQLGMCCPCCGPMVFPILDAWSKRVATITRPALDCSECCLKTNRLRLDFGDVKGPQDRLLLFAAAMLLDLEYFEVKKN